MNDEIKEILERIKTYPEKLYCLSEKEKRILLDYITNLQKTNKNHSKKLIELGNKITNLQQEYERLKEEKDNLYLDNTMLKLEKDIYKQGYEDFKNLLNILQNGSDKNV